MYKEDCISDKILRNRVFERMAKKLQFFDADRLIWTKSEPQINAILDSQYPDVKKWYDDHA